MSIELASWILFGAYLLLGISTYYMSHSTANLSTMFPVLIFWILKTATLIWFAVYFQLWAFIAIAIIDLVWVFLGASSIKKEVKK
jgi:hypothetical protein